MTLCERVCVCGCVHQAHSYLYDRQLAASEVGLVCNQKLVANAQGAMQALPAGVCVCECAQAGICAHVCVALWCCLR